MARQGVRGHVVARRGTSRANPVFIWGAGVLLAGCALLPLSVTAQPRAEQEEEAGDKKLLPELEIRLPPYPKPANLVEFEPSAASSNRFFVDTESILVGSDGIVRYTLVIRGPGGAENVSYEGMRCETMEQKFYAFGRRDGTWSNARASEWRQIRYQEINRQHGVLYVNYFCPDGSPILTAKAAIQRFKYGVPQGAPPRNSNRR
jgi:hypothetical protein